MLRYTKYLPTVILVAMSLIMPSKLAADSIKALKAELSNASSLDDTISTLYRIVDLTTGKEQGEALQNLYEAAVKSPDTTVVLDVLRLQSNYYTQNDSMQQIILSRLDKLPDNDERWATELYVKVNRMSRTVRNMTVEKREQALRQYIARQRSDIKKEMDRYEQMEYLFYLCIYLRNSTDGDLLVKYFQELQDLIQSMPTEDMWLSALFYTQAAMCYVNNEMYDKALEANKLLLDVIDRLEREYSYNGRPYRNYDRSRYVCYRRMLRCHIAMAPEDIDVCYNRILDLAKNNEDVRNDTTISRARIYYYMAKKRYADAVPLLKKHLKTETDRVERRYLIKALAVAAEAVGDKDELLYALKLNDEVLREYIHTKAAESYKELQIIYDVNDLQIENSNLQAENQYIIIQRQNSIMVWALAILIIIVVAFIITLSYYRRSKRLTKRLQILNRQLVEESETLKSTEKQLIAARDKAKKAEQIKTDFVNNMSHEIRTPLSAIVEYSTLIADFADDADRPYVKRFADIVILNTDLLMTLVNDVLNLQSLESDKMSITLQPCSVQGICQLAIDNISKHVKDGVDLVFDNENQKDYVIKTDAHRVEQIVINLLSNAAKFTTTGNIHLSYEFTEDLQEISFTVTDTGPGIPTGTEDRIFESFNKLNPSTQGTGLGLYISRLLAELLGGTLRVDSEYTGGARFVLTIPTNR